MGGKEIRQAKKENGEKLCKHLEGVHDFKPSKETKRSKMEEGKMIFKEIMTPGHSFYYDEEMDEFMFNGQSVTAEVQWMAQSYINHDFKRLGFILGHAIDAHAYTD